MAEQAKDFVLSSSEQVPVVAATDVVVIGAGPAGVSAAISAARNGCSVTLVERYHHLGGMASGGMVLVLDDMVNDIAEINTTVFRQYLDGLYLANNPRNAVLSTGVGVGSEATPMANLDQLLHAVPGGWVEEYQPNAIRPLETQDAAKHALPAIDKMREMRESRTGISRYNQAIDPNALSNTPVGSVVAMQGAAAQRAARTGSGRPEVQREHLAIRRVHGLTDSVGAPFGIGGTRRWSRPHPAPRERGLRARRRGRS